jgi:hypothetical protein
MGRDRGREIPICYGGIVVDPPDLHGLRCDYGGYGRCGPGPDSKSAGSFGRLEYSTTNTLRGTQLGKRGCKDA